MIYTDYNALTLRRNRMAFIPLPNTAKAVIRLTSGDSVWSNVLHFTMAGFDVADMQDLATALGTGFLQEYKEPLASSVSIIGVDIYDMRSQDGPVIHHTYDPAINGGQSDEPPVSLIATAVVTFYGAGRGKNYRGRAYVSGIPEQDADEVRVQQGQYDVLVAAFDTLRTSPPTGWTWVIASTQRNGVKLAEGELHPVVSVVGRSNRWGRQSRRVRRN